MAFSCAEKKSKKKGDERRYSSDLYRPRPVVVSKRERVMVIFNHTVQHENIISITEHGRSSVM